MMSTPPDEDIQKVIAVRLREDAELMSLLAGYGVYDEVDEDASYPYVVVGEAWSTPDNTQSRFGWQTVTTVHVWSESLGTFEVLPIVRRVMQLLDHQPMILPHHHVPGVNYEFHQILRDHTPQKLRHGIVRFRVFTEQND
jgi:hypothetical protein